jgi:hypothetical protein
MDGISDMTVSRPETSETLVNRTGQAPIQRFDIRPMDEFLFELPVHFGPRFAAHLVAPG